MRGEPARVPEIPHPRGLSGTVPFFEAEHWWACGPPPAVRQGFKLYVPLTIQNARAVIERLAPFLLAAGLHFKYVRSIDTLRKLNAGNFGYPQIGKCLVVYLPRPEARLVGDLKALLAPWRDQCPAVPLARPFGDDLPLYYRYGAYEGDELEIGGEKVADQRGDAKAAVPAGVVDELAPFTVPVVPDPAVDAFLRRYPAFEAMHQQGKCGVFLAMNLASETFQEVVLKVGWHRGQVQPDGSDGCSFLRHELGAYRRLAERGLAELAPRLVDALDVPRKVILVLEYVPGTSLLAHLLQGKLTLRHLERCWAMLDRFHAGGVYLGDAKLANFLATDDGDLRALDFEAAGVFGDPPPAVRTFFLDPDPRDPRLGDRAHFLASVLYPYELGRYSWSDRHVDLYAHLERQPKNDHEAWALAHLESLLAQVAANAPPEPALATRG